MLACHSIHKFVVIVIFIFSLGFNKSIEKKLLKRSTLRKKIFSIIIIFLMIK